jgi:hypothetical protein
MITILYPYYAAAAAGDELRLSLRSIAENLVGDFEPCIVGDVPDWYTGAAIPLTRITQGQYRQCTGRRFHDKWHYLVDQAWKYAAASQCDQVSETFVVFYDETYVMRRVNVDYLLVPKYRGDMPSEPLNRNAYWDAMMRSLERLQAKGLPTLDFDSHHPFPICKHDLPLYYHEFNPLVCPGSFPNQYHNWRRSECRIHLDSEFEYVNARKCESGKNEWSRSNIVNYATVTAGIESRLRTRFATPSPWEKQ